MIVILEAYSTGRADDSDRCLVSAHLNSDREERHLTDFSSTTTNQYYRISTTRALVRMDNRRGLACPLSCRASAAVCGGPFVCFRARHTQHVIYRAAGDQVQLGMDHASSRRHSVEGGDFTSRGRH
jgi:hypothetical protein